MCACVHGCVCVCVLCNVHVCGEWWCFGYDGVHCFHLCLEPHLGQTLDAKHSQLALIERTMSAILTDKCV